MSKVIADFSSAGTRGWQEMSPHQKLEAKQDWNKLPNPEKWKVIEKVLEQSDVRFLRARANERSCAQKNNQPSENKLVSESKE